MASAALHSGTASWLRPSWAAPRLAADALQVLWIKLQRLLERANGLSGVTGCIEDFRPREFVEREESGASLTAER